MALIVLMEDDAATRTLIASVLKKDGHDRARRGKRPPGLLLVQSHKPDLVISDVQMPELNGFEMLASLRQDPEIAATPVILLTSLQERAHMRIGMTSGADDYITKPFRPGELREAAAAQLNKRHAGQPAGPGHRQGRATRWRSSGTSWPSSTNAARARTERALAHRRRPHRRRAFRFSATVLFVDIPSYAGVARSSIRPS
jgi:DNA-binding response OmpR family regulator